MQSLKLHQISAIDQVRAEEWNACAADGNPFVQHAYINALETSGAAGAQNGYLARHLLVRDRDGVLVAVAPTYVKGHSYAEIGSDFGWSVAHERMVGPYYPKLQVEVPNTPTPGRRLLVRPGGCAEAAKAVLVDGLLKEMSGSSLSSLHISFLDCEDWHFLRSKGFLCDIGIRFVWSNAGYTDFEDFLRDLKTVRRAKIRRERREFAGSNLRFHRVEGEAITRDFIGHFVPLFLSTYTKYETPPPLNANTFHKLRDSMSGSLMFNTAYLKDELVAATMFMFGGRTLYALHWGSAIQQRFLHYELTYYQGIEFAIERGFETFDGGPVGQHKPPRGLRPVPSLYAHRFANREFASLVEKGNSRRVEAVLAQIAALEDIYAFRTGLGVNSDAAAIYAFLGR